MHIGSRSIPSKALSPIAAYRAVARPGEGCVLESGKRRRGAPNDVSIGCDYRVSRSFAGNESMFDDMRDFVEAHRPQGDGTKVGGALVVLAYDAARNLARLPKRNADAPQMPDAYVAIPGTWLFFDRHRGRIALWGFGDSKAETEARLDERCRQLTAVPADPLDDVCASGPVWQSLEREQYLGLVDRVKTHIFDGDCYQLQLGIRFATRLRGTSLDLYRALCTRNASPYSFFVDAPFGQLLGASPEFLVRLQGVRARIRPLAGTRPRGTDQREDRDNARALLASEKERAEHVMLVDLARNDLGAVCRTGSVRVEELMKIERYSHVMHIVSQVSGELRPEADAFALLRATFPAGTVTGTPKVRAMELIDELEPVTRGAYAGSVGRLSFDGEFDSCITLRCVHVQDGRAHWQASAGIVADSDPAAEYAEILHKTHVVRDVLAVP